MMDRVKAWEQGGADRVRGPMEIRDRPEMKIMVPNADYQAEIDGLRRELAAMEKERNNYRLAYYQIIDDLDELLGKKR